MQSMLKFRLHVLYPKSVFLLRFIKPVYVDNEYGCTLASSVMHGLYSQFYTLPTCHLLAHTCSTLIIFHQSVCVLPTCWLTTIL